MSFTKVKGTYDVLPAESPKWQALENYIRNLYGLYQYKEIRTPMMEYSQVIHRESEDSDMVTKETYNFKDKSDRDLTLRPEGTAGVIRSYVENKIYATSNLSKFYYIGPNFRYERPQKGRFRQFMQFGIEALGSTDASVDAEVITLAYETISKLGLKNAVVKINSLGDQASKSNYREALKAYLAPLKHKLSPDSQLRLEKNPLRILDSKDPVDQELLLNAPMPLEHLTEESMKHYQMLVELLSSLHIPYELDKKLVRGLDYYSHTVFEIHATIDGFGAQNALGGGGRYHELVKEMGGPEIPGIGFAFGMERLLNALEAEGITLSQEQRLDAYLINFGNETKKEAFKSLYELRNSCIHAEMDFSNKNFKTQLKDAIKLNAKYVIIFGDDELKLGQVTVKNTETQEQSTIAIKELVAYMKGFLS
ncbi:Histidine--tRNA ligase [Acholeplasma oculi]|uniref:Histidine--tRNA ligase n=1 Tax=Acholeplasma oculi TaxID=35623 RepID=A0A061AAX8_9MOLU|nr:histidine--tRNA ligase [Acholeplasma oculi]CDR31003.1 Histidyl-tRNA synthetase [Acholeplasma oculi]SKC36184.1 histidyl-tRNA synthetase [Acholeplasma oculi]SUT90442.1 Histidine--tRNA ligase [Acholeplasma oculi]